MPPIAVLARPKISLAIALVVLAGAVVALYFRGLNSPFVFDDSESVTDNASINRLWPLVGDRQYPGPLNPTRDTTTAGRPLVNLSLAVNYHFGQLNPIGYHVFNLIVHVLTAFLLMAIVRRTLQLDYFDARFQHASGPLAFAAALLWAVHPLQTETVIYVTQRTELMVGCFYLATLYASLRYWAATSSAARSTWLVLAALACLAGAASKEVIVTAPLVVLLFERTFVAATFRQAFKNSWPLYLGLMLSWGLLLYLNHDAPRSDSAGFHLEVPAYAWWFTQAKVLWMYLKLAIWPWPLSIHYQMPYSETLAAAWPWVLATALLGAATLVLLWRRSAFGFVAAWVLLILSPTLVVPIVTEVAAERRMYLPLVGLVTLAVVAGCWLALQTTARLASSVGGANRSSPWPMASAAIAAILLAAAWGAVSVRRLAAYQDNVTLWQENVNYQPRDPISYNNLGLSLARAGLPQLAIQQFENTLQLNPHHASAHSNLSVLLNNLGRTQEAIEHGELALKINPDSSAAHNNLGNALVHAGRKQEAIHHYQEALRLRPEYADAHNNLGFMLADSGRPQEAIREYEEALRINPNYALAHSNLGGTLLNMGQPEKAAPHFQETIRLQPENVDARINLGIALASMGRPTEAIAAFEQTLQLQPNNPRAHNNLGLTLANRGRPREAVAHYQQAIRLQPDYSQAYANLANAFAQLHLSSEALAAGEKGLELARAQGQTALAQQLENWLKTHRAAAAGGQSSDPQDSPAAR